MVVLLNGKRFLPILGVIFTLHNGHKIKFTLILNFKMHKFLEMKHPFDEQQCCYHFFQRRSLGVLWGKVVQNMMKQRTKKGKPKVHALGVEG